MITGGFILGFATRTFQLPQTRVLIFVVLAAAIWTATTWIAANWSDRIGRINVFTIGYVFSIVWTSRYSCC